MVLRCEEVRPFHGLDGLLLTMEAMMDEAGDQLSDPRHFEQGKLCTAAVCVYARQHASIQGEAGFPAFPLKLFISRARWNYCACSVTIWSNGQKGGDTT